MEDERRTKRQLIEELRALRSRVAELEQPDRGIGPQGVRNMMEEIPAILWTLDRDLRLTWWRGGAIPGMGLEAEAQIGVSVYDFFGADNPEHPSILAHNAALEGESRNFEVQIAENMWVQAHVEPLRDQGNAIRGVVGVALDITERVRMEEERVGLISELREALEQVKTLSGLIPICSHCRRMRDDRGYWQQVETFMRQHSDAELSHGICPECIKLLLPDAS